MKMTYDAGAAEFVCGDCGAACEPQDFRNPHGLWVCTLCGAVESGSEPSSVVGYPVHDSGIGEAPGDFPDVARSGTGASSEAGSSGDSGAGSELDVSSPPEVTTLNSEWQDDIVGTLLEEHRQVQPFSAFRHQLVRAVLMALVYLVRNTPDRSAPRWRRV